MPRPAGGIDSARTGHSQPFAGWVSGGMTAGPLRDISLPDTTRLRPAVRSQGTGSGFQPEHAESGRGGTIRCFRFHRCAAATSTSGCRSTTNSLPSAAASLRRGQEAGISLPGHPCRCRAWRTCGPAAVLPSARRFAVPGVRTDLRARGGGNGDDRARYGSGPAALAAAVSQGVRCRSPDGGGRRRRRTRARVLSCADVGAADGRVRAHPLRASGLLRLPCRPCHNIIR